MNKSELVTAVAHRTGVSASDVQKTVTTVLDVIQDECARGGEIRLVGFGIFSVRDVGERKARNLQTGAEIIIPATRVPKFTAGAKFKEVVAK